MLLLLGQASADFSHGSEPSEQTAAAISPVTLFHEWSDGSQGGLRKTSSRRAAPLKHNAEHVQTSDYARLILGAFVESELEFEQKDP